jgi:nickel/cobalt exporter
MLWACALALLVSGTCFLAPSHGSAQGAKHPFAVGAAEGAATPGNPLSRFILVLEGNFYRLLTGAVRATKDRGAAAWSLVALSFAYGVVHAAGPGHGKAVIASYLIANERTLHRGVVISAAAAILQAGVAVAIVATAALLLQATSKQMTQAANLVEIASYASITMLGCFLVYKKGKALLRSVRAARGLTLEAAFAAAAASPGAARASDHTFCAADASLTHEHDASCGHLVALQRGSPGDAGGFEPAVLTVLAAGLRPCSGAILVLVFSLSQGVLTVGIVSVAAMAIGTMITTSALAAFAVLGKRAAEKLVNGSNYSFLIGRVIEVTAAVVVLAFGLVLLTASLAPAFRI